MLVDNEALLKDSEVIGKNIPPSSIDMENTKVEVKVAFLNPFTISLASHFALPRFKVSVVHHIANAAILEA